jgi:uncharacterized repeat protein (TIGR01451 family)
VPLLIAALVFSVLSLLCQSPSLAFMNPDLYEPDNQIIQAKNVILNTLLTDRNMYPKNDIDWVKFTLTTTSDIQIRTTGYPGAPDQALYSDPNGYHYVTTSSGGILTSRGLEPGEYFLKLSSYNVCYTYDLIITATPVSYTTDQSEDDNSMDKAPQVSVNQTGSAHSLFPITDEDWFQFNITEQSNIFVNIQAGRDDLFNIYFYNSESTYTVQSAYRQKYLSITGQNAGTYYVKIWGSDRAGYHTSVKEYFPTIYARPVGETIEADQYEPDDDYSTAPTLTLGVPQENHSVYPAYNYDYTKFFLATPSDLTATVLNPGPLTYDFYLTSPDGNFSYNPSDGRDFQAFGLQPGTYYLRLYPNSSTTIAGYGLLVESTPSVLSRDIYENDDDRFSPSQITPGIPQTGRSIYPAEDVDWVRFTCDQPSDVNISAQCSDNALMVFELYKDDYTDSSYLYYSSANTNNLRVMGLQAGSWLLRLRKNYTTSGYSYDLSVDATPTIFRTDAKEPSDVYTAATLLPANTPMQGLSLYPAGDQDWYKFTLTETSNFNLIVNNYEAYSTNIDVYYGIPSDSTKIANQYYSQITLYEQPAGTYYVKVIYNYDNIPIGEYDINLEVTATTSGDTFEPDSTYQQARVLAPGTVDGPHTIHYAIDEDWYKFTLAQESGITLEATVINNATTYNTYVNMYLYYGPADSSYLAYSYSNKITRTPLKAGTYYVKVYRYSGTFDGTYSIKLTATATGNPNPGDTREPNDNYLEATTLTPGSTLSNLSFLPAADKDWFKFTLAQDSNIQLDTTMVNPNARYGYHYLYADPTGSSLTYDYLNGTESTISFNALAAGTYYIRSYLSSTSYTMESYTLTLTTTPTTVAPDSAEAGDGDNTWEHSTVLTSGQAITNRTIHNYRDQDWYQFTLTQKSDVTITPTNVTDSTQSYLYRNPGESAINYGYSSAFITYSLDPGTYYLKFIESSSNNVCGNYSVLLETTSTSPGDSYESDDLFSLAREILPGVRQTDRSIHNPNDIDWIKFTLHEASDIIIGASVESGSVPNFYLYRAAAPTSSLASSSWYSSSHYRISETFLSPGDYLVKFYNSYNTINNYTAYLQASRAPSTDLEITGCVLSPTVNVQTGDTITFRVTVKNNGDAFTQNVKIGARIDGYTYYSSSRIKPGSDPQVYEYQVPYKTFAGFTAGEVKTFDLTWWAVPRSTSYAIITDMDSEILETNETNNVFMGAFPFELNFSDLTISGVTITPDPASGTITHGTIVNFRAAVKNWGDAFNSSHWYYLYTSYYSDPANPATENWVYIGQVSSAGYAAGEIRNIDLTWTAGPGEHKRFKVIADSWNNIREKDENNNEFIGDLNVTLQKSDLRVTGVTVSPQTGIVQGTPVNFDITVLNDSNAYVDTYHRYELWLNGAEAASTFAYGLEANASKVIRLTWIAKSGVFSGYTVKVDSTNRVPEHIEDNNSFTDSSWAVTVAESDLTVASLQFAHTSNWDSVTLRDGDSTQFTAVIQNLDSGPVNIPFRVMLKVDDKSVESREIRTMAGSASETVTFNWIARGNTSNISVTVDSDNRVLEKNETNNTLARTLTAFPAPDLTVSALSILPATGLKDGSPTNIMATVKNIGAGGTVKPFNVRFSVNGNTLSTLSYSNGLTAGAENVFVLPWEISSGSVNATAIADVYNAVGESNESNNELSIDLPSIDMPNFTIQSMVWTNTEIYDGCQLTVKALLKNVGSGDTAKSINMDFMVDGSKVFSWTHSGGMASGSTTEVVGQWLYKSGQKSVVLAVNPNNVIRESNYSDNSMTISLPDSPRPDLELSLIGWEPRNFNLNDPITLYASVKNIGKGKTITPFSITFAADDRTVQTYNFTKEMPADRAEQISVVWKAAYAKTFKVTVDPRKAVGEAAETLVNNVKTAEFPEIPLPDLAVLSMTYSPVADLAQGDKVEVKAQIKNQGVANSSNLTAVLKVDDKIVDSRGINGGLWSGMDVTMTFNWYATPGTSRKLRVEVDPNNTVPEGAVGESNNFMEQVFALDIPGADFILENLTMDKGGVVIASTDQVRVGDVITFGATVRNGGTGPYTKTIPVGFFIDNNFVKSVDVSAGLAVNATSRVTADWTVPSSRTNRVNIMVDPFSKLTEINEGNNVLSSALPTFPLPDLQVTSLTSDFDNTKTYTEQDPITFTATVGNTGNENITSDVDVKIQVGFFTLAQTIAGGLNSGASKTLTFVWPAVTRSSVSAVVTADPDNIYAEGSESNNTGSLGIGFTKPVEKHNDILVTLSPATQTLPIGGTCFFTADITSRMDTAGYLDISATGLEGLKTTIYPPRIYATSGERYKVRIDVDVPADYNLATKSVFDFKLKVSALTIFTEAAAQITLVGAPAPENLRPADATKTGATEMLVTWKSLVSGTSVVYFKAQADTAYTKVEGIAGTQHQVRLTGLQRNTVYSYYVESTGPGGTYSGLGTDERTFTVDNGIVFSAEKYDFTVNKDYNQLVTLNVKNNDSVSHILQLELENPFDELIVGFLGGGSVDYPIPLNAGQSRSVTLALHLQDANQESYEIFAKISSTRDGQTLVAKVPVKINVHIPIVDYSIQELESNPVTLVKKFRITNKGDVITDFNVLFPDEFKDAVVMSPDIAHYKLNKGETLNFTAIPVLGHPIFMDKFGTSNTVVSSSGVRALATNRRVAFQVAGQVKGLGEPRYSERHTRVAARGVKMLVSAGVNTSFDAPDGTTPRPVDMPNLNYEAEAKTWHCTNRPNVEVDIPVPPIDVSDDPLYIDFTPNGGWEQRPHDVNIFINGHLVASWKNQIPTGTKQIDFDPSILNIPKVGVAKNRIDIRTIHMNGGHYVVSSNVKLLMHLNEYNSWVMAKSDTEAWSLAEQNLPDNIKKAPDSVTFDALQTEERIVEGTPTLLKIKPKLANGQGAKKIQVTANVGGQNITFTDQDNDGVYEGMWTPKLSDADTFVASKEISALSKKCMTMEVKTKYGTTIETVCVEESDLKVDILTPESGFQANLGQTYSIKAKVTNKDGNGVTDPDMINISFSNGDTGGAMNAVGGGEFYFDWKPTKDNSNNPGPVQIDVNASHSEYGTASDSISGKTTAKTDLEIKKISCKYSGHVFYIDGIDFEVEYAVEVNWNGAKPGSVIFKTNKGSDTVKTESETEPVKKKMNMGKSFGLGGTLMVKAVSAEGDSESEWKKADFTIAGRVPFQDALKMASEEDSGKFAYKSGIGAIVSFIKPLMSGDVIPSWVPVVGNKPFLLDFIPKVSSEFMSDGKGKYMLEWESDNLKKETDINRTTTDKSGKKVAGKFAGAEFTLTPKVNVTGACVQDKGNWKWGGQVGAEGAAEISKSWPFIFTLGPVPIPMYAKITIKVSMEGLVGIQDFSAGKWQVTGDVAFGPYLKGSLGVGLDGKFSVEGWLGGGCTFEFGWPGNGTSGYKGAKILLNAGITITAWLWSWDWEGIKYEWPGDEPSKSSILSTNEDGMVTFRLPSIELKQPRLLERNYVNRTGFGLFKTDAMNLNAQVSTLAEKANPRVAALATSTFPHSAPCIDAAGLKLYMVWLADDSTKTSLNRTVMKFATWDGTSWTGPSSVGTEDGTGDFHPFIKVFSNGDAVVAWENVSEVLADGTSFDTFVTKLEISAATYSAATGTWSEPVRLSSNSSIDWNPRVAGTSSSNVMVTWLNNESNDMTGNSTSPNKIMFAKWNGTTWTTAAQAASVDRKIIKYSLVYNGTNGDLVFSADGAPVSIPSAAIVNDEEVVTSAVRDREIYRLRYLSGIWVTPAKLTDDDQPDDNPQLCYDTDGQVVLVWLKANEISWTRNFNMGLVEIINTQSGFSNNIADARLISSDQGRFGLVWAESSGYSSDLYTMFYDHIEKLWGLPKRLTGDSETERNVTASFYGNESIVSVYNRNLVGQVQTTSVTALGQTVEVVIPQTIDTSLYMMRYVLNDDMIASEMALNPANPAEGSTLEIYLTVFNNSDRAVKNVPVNFYNGDPQTGGTLIGTETITTLMASGTSVVVSHFWPVPAGSLPLSIFAVVDPDSTFDTDYRHDNTISVEGGKPDLVINSLIWDETSQGVFQFTATVVNKGPMSAAQTTAVFLNMTPGANEAVMTTEVLPAMASGATAEVTCTWNTGGVAQPEYPVKLKVDPDNLVAEFNEADNERVSAARGTLSRAEVNPESIAFGNIGVGSNYATKIITLRNTGSAALTVGKCVIGGTNEAEFVITEDNCSSKVLQPLDSVTLRAGFTPKTAGAKAAWLDIPSDDPARANIRVLLAGSGSDVALHSLAIDPVRIPMKANESFDLANIAVRAVFSDGTVNAPSTATWAVLTGGGAIANGVYTAGASTGTAYLTCTHTVGTVSKSVQLRIDVVSPQPPNLAALTFSENSPAAVAALATTVTVIRNCRIAWTGYDSDTAYQNWLYWSTANIAVNDIPEELESATSRLRPINMRPVLDSRFATSAQPLSHDWDVSTLYTNTEVFPEGTTTSNTLYLYCVALDDSPMPRDAGTQIIASADTLKVQKPDASNSAPLFAFTTLATENVAGASGKASIGFKIADETTDTVKVQFFHNKLVDSSRALTCTGIKPDDNSQITEVSITPTSTTLDGADTQTFTWDLTGITEGSYLILAKYTDSKHPLAEAWSAGKVTVAAEVTGNVAPSLEWLTPSFRNKVNASTGSVDLSFRVMDDDNDTLLISLYYNRSTVIDANLVKLGQTYEVSSTSAWVGKTFSFDVTGLSNGFYYIMAAVKQKDKGFGVFKYWSLVPVIVDRASGISMLRVGTPQLDTANAGKASVNVIFATSEDATGIVKYGLKGFTNLEARTTSTGKTHVINLTKLEAGKRYYFKVYAEAVSGSRYEMDNFGKLYSFFVPAASAQAVQARWIRGKVNHSQSCIVKVYLTRKNTDGTLAALAKPLISGLDTNGEWAVNLGSSVNSATGATMEPLSTDFVRVEIFAADGKFRYFEDISINGIEFATTSFAGLAPETLWASGYGVELPDEYMDFKIDLKRGFNLVALPMEPETALTAKTILESAGNDASAVYYFSTEDGQYKAYLKTGTIFLGTNFSVDITKGFFLKMNAAGTITIRGRKIGKAETLTALKGFNMMTVSYGSDFPATTETAVSATELLRSIGDDGVAVYSFVDGRYKSVIRLKSGDTSDCFFAFPEDFMLKQGSGYFIKLRENASFKPEDFSALEDDK